jgi:hypothetical protein
MMSRAIDRDVLTRGMTIGGGGDGDGDDDDDDDDETTTPRVEEEEEDEEEEEEEDDDDDDDDDDEDIVTGRARLLEGDEHEGCAELLGCGGMRSSKLSRSPRTPKTPRGFRARMTTYFGDSANASSPRTPESTTTTTTTAQPTLDAAIDFGRVFSDTRLFIIEVFVGIPIQILLTFIALVCIPCTLQGAPRLNRRARVS